MVAAFDENIVPKIEFCVNKIFVPIFKYSIPELLVSSAPPYFFFTLKEGFLLLKAMSDFRMMLGWFPEVNQQKLIFLIFTEPIDTLVFRPCYHLVPKVAYLDTMTWVSFFVLDSIIEYLTFLTKLSEVYYRNL
jgi:hypothetical protein